MPDLQLNYAETPPWLKNDAQESTFLRDIESSQRINQQRQQLPLKLKAMQQDVQMQDLKIGETIRQRDELLQAEREAQALGPSIAPYFKEGKPQKAINELLAAAANNPLLVKAPQWQNLMKSAQTAVTTQNLLDYRIEQEKGRNLRATDSPVVKARAALLAGQLEALQKGKSTRPTDFEANVNFINKQLEEAGHEPLSNSEFMDMAQRHMGVLPRASAAGQWFDKAQVNALVKEHGELQKEINELQTSPPPRTKAQREQRAQSIAAKLARQTKINAEIEEKRSKVEAQLKGALRPEDTPAIEFKTAQEVGDAYKAGEITEEDARRILAEKFGLK